MRHETYRFIQLGVWDRQPELLKEARMLHRANRAVREARRRAPLATAVDAAHQSPLANAWRPAGVAQLPLPSFSWRTAAARMGTSLVTLGRRLECIGRVGVVGRG